MRIYLNRFELRAAAQAGIERRIVAIQRGRSPLYGVDDRKAEWQIDIIGCIAEFALAKYLNVYWTSVVDEGLTALPGDVGKYQVRSTSWKTGNLIIHNNDSDDAIFLLAVVGDRYVDFPGWIYAWEGKERGTKKDNENGIHFWVNQELLNPIEKLPEAS